MACGCNKRRQSKNPIVPKAVSRVNSVRQANRVANIAKPPAVEVKSFAAETPTKSMSKERREVEMKRRAAIEKRRSK